MNRLPSMKRIAKRGSGSTASPSDSPATIGGLRVTCFSGAGWKPRVDCSSFGIAQGAVLRVAICEQTPSGPFYLFGCNEHWASVSDSFHLSLNEAKAQAEAEYPGISETWMTPKWIP